MNKEKLIKCGCGGEAEIFHIAPEGYEGSYCVRCTECLTQTPFFNKDKNKAIEIWNKAMGHRIGKWIKWEAANGIDSGIECSECGYKCNAYPGYGSAFCPTCGAEMINE